MVRILFIPSNLTHVKMFRNIFSILKNGGNNVKAICIDSFKHEGARKLLITLGTPYKNIEDYGTKNVAAILQQEKADVVILGNDFAPIEKSFVIAANYLKIPSILIQDGLITAPLASNNGVFRIVRYLKELVKWVKMYAFLINTLLVISFSPRKLISYLLKDLMKRAVYTHTYGSSGCDIIAVSGDAAKKTFMCQGVPAERIVITGQPRFDEVFTRMFEKLTFLKQAGIYFDKKVAVLCTQPFVEYKFWTKAERKKFLVSIAHAFGELPDVQLVIKLHPAEAILDYELLLRNIVLDMSKKPCFVILKNVELYDLISVSDILMTVNSTVALEAMILKKPVIIVDFFGNSTNNIYAQSGAALAVSNSSELVSAITALLEEGETYKKLAKKRDVFVYEQAYKIDGKASERVAKLIIETAAVSNN